MKNKYNTLSKYIFENSEREYRKETIEGLFRSVLEPVISNQKIEACILLKLNSLYPFESIIKRLKFSSTKIIGYCNLFDENYSKEDIWADTEFVVVLGQRYSAALIWDYSYSENNSSNICLLFNSKIITDIAKEILNNSSFDFKDILSKYSPDRRENISMNLAINSISSLYNDKNNEFLFSENEKKSLIPSDETYKTAEIVAEKAKFIAHEVKNNLSIINLYSKILEKRISNVDLESEIAESVQNSIKNITNASENVSALINDLRCLSAPYITELSLKEFINSTVMLCKEKANASEVIINIAEFEDKLVHTDKIKLQCSLMNIIYNAIEACNKGDKINVEIKICQNNIEIIVKNTGEIIPENIKDKIFEADFTTKKSGNGLGLAICKKQMQILKGDIVLEYSTNKETSFKIILPA